MESSTTSRDTSKSCLVILNLEQNEANDVWDRQCTMREHMGVMWGVLHAMNLI